jgi:hypothetical protein
MRRQVADAPGGQTLSERAARLLEQMKLEFEELKAPTTEDELPGASAERPSGPAHAGYADPRCHVAFELSGGQSLDPKVVQHFAGSKLRP